MNGQQQAQVRPSRTASWFYRVIVLSLVLSCAGMLSSCAEEKPAKLPAEPLTVVIPADDFDAAVTEVYSQYLVQKYDYRIKRLRSSPANQHEFRFFNEHEVHQTLNRLMRGEASLALVRSGQALNILDPNTVLVPVQAEPTAEVTTTPSPPPQWPSDAPARDRGLEEKIPFTIRAAPASSGQRGVAIYTSPVVKIQRQKSQNKPLEDQCATLRAVAAPGLLNAQIKAELQARYRCKPLSFAEEKNPQNLQALMMAGRSELLFEDSLDSSAQRSGLVPALGDDALLRGDYYRPLIGIKNLDDEQVASLSEKLGKISERLDQQGLKELYSFLNEQPQMGPAKAATWWLHKHGLIPEGQ